MKLILVLHNIRSVYNVGAILRTAEGLGVDEVAFSGYTPRYDDQKLLPHLRAKLDRQIEKSALGAEKMVKQASVDDLAQWLEAKKVEGVTIVGLENNLDSEESARRILLNDAEQLRDSSVVLILGEEVNGIPREIREACQYFLEIPMKGRKESFNVSVAAGIAMWGLGNAKVVSKPTRLRLQPKNQKN